MLFVVDKSLWEGTAPASRRRGTARPAGRIGFKAKLLCVEHRCVKDDGFEAAVPDLIKDEYCPKSAGPESGMLKGSITAAVSGHGSVGAGAGVGYRW
ncbi:hypothetical protein [Paraburkholderia terricola]|uniref:hypothetical protein n=1 Tax=Paraburkholderia terricola TaxID=169427 RepID=UPI000DF01E62|nr:hypothetical protein [Paraburkholderia terricola]AXE92704.1 hypothetical protein CUJ90_10375 [Paraburkholderia terricola]